MNFSDNRVKMKHRSVLDLKKDMIKLELNLKTEKRLGKALAMRVSKLEREIRRLSIKKHPVERKEDADQPQLPPEVHFASTDIRYKVREVYKVNTGTESKPKQQPECESGPKSVAIPWWKIVSCPQSAQWPGTESDTQETTVSRSKTEKETNPDTNHWWRYLESPQWSDLALEELLEPGTKMYGPPASLVCTQLVHSSTVRTNKPSRSSFKIIDCVSGSDDG